VWRYDEDVIVAIWETVFVASVIAMRRRRWWRRVHG